MKKRGLIVLGVLIAGLAGAAVILLSADQKKERKGFSVFSWNEAIMTEPEEDLGEYLEQADITRVFQEFTQNSLESGEAEDFIRRMKSRDIEVFALTGNAEWALEPEALLDEMERIAEYNQEKDSGWRIPGIIVDVEPYLLPAWEEGDDARAELMNSYLECMERAYEYARQNDLIFWVCIPTFYDATCDEILESLIADACDGTAVMNYNRTDEYLQMAKEVGYAREYGKQILCIYELQQPGYHDLEEINTYYGPGLEALWQSAERLERQFGYEKLEFAYHYYSPLKEMLEEREQTGTD